MQFLGLALLAGAAAVVQIGVNSRLRTSLGQPLFATLVSYLVGTASVLLLLAVTRARLPAPAMAASAPWWAWIGGALGAVYVSLAIVLAPRLGGALLTGAIVCGQMLCALLVDQFGLVGFARREATPGRIAGAVLIALGVALLQRR